MAAVLYLDPMLLPAAAVRPSRCLETKPSKPMRQAARKRSGPISPGSNRRLASGAFATTSRSLDPDLEKLLPVPVQDQQPKTAGRFKFVLHEFSAKKPGLLPRGGVARHLHGDGLEAWSTLYDESVGLHDIDLSLQVKVVRLKLSDAFQFLPIEHGDFSSFPSNQAALS
jgi:hypothetical protein